MLAVCTHLSMYPPMQKVHSVPLGVAAEKGHKETVERLLREKVNINYRNKVNSTYYVTSAHYTTQCISCDYGTPS